jgi:hypothetical protein
MAGSLIGRLSFSAPVKSRILVFDANGDAILSRTALQGLEHGVLPSRGEVFYLAPSVLARMLKYIGEIEWGLIARRGGRGLFGQLYKVHLLACVDAVAPEVVVTWIDNSWLFHRISRAYPAARFYAVQNGSRSLGCVTTNPPLKVPGGYVISMPHLLCFGDYERDLYARHHHQVDEFHAVGPLIAGYYRSLHPLPAGPARYDLCLVSQWRAELMSPVDNPLVSRTIETLSRHLARYARERGASVCVAARSSDPAETEFHRSMLGPDAAIISSPDGALPLSSYEAIDASAVAVAFCSTTLLEAFGWGKKVLFCNLFRDAESYSPRPGPWSVEEPGYEAFRDKLDALRAMSDEAYRAASAEFSRYAVHYGPKPAHLHLRELVLGKKD